MMPTRQQMPHRKAAPHAPRLPIDTPSEASTPAGTESAIMKPSFQLSVFGSVSSSTVATAMSHSILGDGPLSGPTIRRSYASAEMRVKQH